MLIPADRPLLTSKSSVKQMRTWPEGAVSALKDSFECTEWNAFREAATVNRHRNLGEYTESVLGFISKCVEDVYVIENITTSANKKLRLTRDVHTSENM